MFAVFATFRHAPISLSDAGGGEAAVVVHLMDFMGLPS